MAEINKPDEGLMSWFELDLDRRSSGLYFNAKADKRVEDFIASLGFNENDPIEAYSRLWVPTGDPLRVYRLSQELDGRFSDRYILTAPGAGLQMDGMLNLSFLRLVGLSRPGGVSFRIEHPMSKSQVGNIRAKLLDGVRDLLQEYIVPVHVILQLVSKPCKTCHGQD